MVDALRHIIIAACHRIFESAGANDVDWDDANCREEVRVDGVRLAAPIHRAIIMAGVERIRRWSG